MSRAGLFFVYQLAAVAVLLLTIWRAAAAFLGGLTL